MRINAKIIATHISRIGCATIGKCTAHGARSCVNSLHKEFKFFFHFKQISSSSVCGLMYVCVCVCARMHVRII